MPLFEIEKRISNIHTLFLKNRLIDYQFFFKKYPYICTYKETQSSKGKVFKGTFPELKAELVLFLFGFSIII